MARVRRYVHRQRVDVPDRQGARDGTANTLGGKRLLYFYTDESVGPKALNRSDMNDHRLEPAIAKLLDGQPRELP